MVLTFVVQVTVEHRAGLFASKEDIAEAIVSTLDDADPGEIEAGDNSEYEITEWSASLQQE